MPVGDAPTNSTPTEELSQADQRSLTTAREVETVKSVREVGEVVIKELVMAEQSSKNIKIREGIKKDPNHSNKPREGKVERRKFIVKGRLGRRKVRILIDSGSNLNCVSEKFMKRVGLPKRRSKEGILIRTVDGGDIGRVEWETVLSLEMEGRGIMAETRSTRCNKCKQ
jgi:hypothetical protein